MEHDIYSYQKNTWVITMMYNQQGKLDMYIESE